MSEARYAARNAAGLVRDLSVIAVDRDGKAVRMTETERLARTIPAIKKAATPPWQCGDRIPVAPARGPVHRFEPTVLVPDGKGGLDVKPDGYRCRSGARCIDVFDVMVNQARRAHEGRVRAYDAETRKMARDGLKIDKRKAPPFVAPFTWGQVQIARDYAALVERCAASGVKCSSLESLRQASSSGGDREAAIFADFARLRALHRRIGSGLAKKMRRQRPSESSSGPDRRKTIACRRLVDLVCLGEVPLEKILKEHGWTGNGHQIRDLRSELCMALDRMQGYAPDRPRNMG